MISYKATGILRKPHMQKRFIIIHPELMCKYKGKTRQNVQQLDLASLRCSLITNDIHP